MDPLLQRIDILVQLLADLINDKNEKKSEEIEQKQYDFDKLTEQYGYNKKTNDWAHRIWTKYQSIESDPNKVPILSTGNDCEWCVTEKVHGANFSILYNGKEFVAAKLYQHSTKISDEHNIQHSDEQNYSILRMCSTGDGNK